MVGICLLAKCPGLWSGAQGSVVRRNVFRLPARFLTRRRDYRRQISVMVMQNRGTIRAPAGCKIKRPLGFIQHRFHITATPLPLCPAAGDGSFR